MSWTTTPPSEPGWHWQRAHYGEHVDQPEPRMFCYSTRSIDGQLREWPEGGLGFSEGDGYAWCELAVWSDPGAHGQSGWRDWWDEPITEPPGQ